MAASNSTADDHALLARLNALKKSTIDLDPKKPAFESSQPNLPVDPAPARALHTDLVSRFKLLNAQSDDSSLAAHRPARNQSPDLLADEDGKTVEDLLAELGVGDSWNIVGDEESQIEGLLSAAQESLAKSQQVANAGHEGFEDDATAPESRKRMDAQTSQASAAKKQFGPREPSEAEIDQEADEYLAQVLEEIKHTPKGAVSGDIEDNSGPSQSNQGPPPQAESSTSLDFPSAPFQALDPPPSYSETTADDELASRFVNLSFPSVPTAINPKPTKPTTRVSKQPQKGFTNEEIDSWCIICNDDATLQCIGCDGDLYCTKCWLDGHKGRDAGYEERGHKAVQYNKGGGLKKQPARRTMIGA